MRGGDVLQGDGAIPAGNRVDWNRAAGKGLLCVGTLGLQPSAKGANVGGEHGESNQPELAMHGVCQAYSPHAEACRRPRLPVGVVSNP